MRNSRDFPSGRDGLFWILDPLRCLRGSDLRPVCLFRTCFLVSQLAGCIFVSVVGTYSFLSFPFYFWRICRHLCSLSLYQCPNASIFSVFFLRLLPVKLLVKYVERESSSGWPTSALLCHPVLWLDISHQVSQVIIHRSELRGVSIPLQTGPSVCCDKIYKYLLFGIMLY